jgi:ATP-binding cassette subfamily B protein
VDTRTEAAIMDAMTRLMSGRTTLMIAHRLSTLEMCDERLQIEGGRLVDAASIQATGQQPAPDGIGGPRGHGDRPRGRVGQWLRRASGSAP